MEGPLIMDIDLIKNIITISFFIMTVFSLIVVIRYAGKNVGIYFLIPVMLFVSVYVDKNMERIMGYPVTVEDISGEKMYVHHMVSRDMNWIYIWTVDPNSGVAPRAYKIPYTPEDEKKMAEANDKKGKGLPQGIELPSEKNQGGDPIGIKLYDFNKMKGVTK
jgi:hypothetical protein